MGRADALGPQHPANRGGGHPVAESRQPTRDPLVTPEGVLERPDARSRPALRRARVAIPGRFGEVQWRRTIRRCQPTRVSGRTTNTGERPRGGNRLSSDSQALSVASR